MNPELPAPKSLSELATDVGQPLPVCLHPSSTDSEGVVDFDADLQALVPEHLRAAFAKALRRVDDEGSKM